MSLTFSKPRDHSSRLFSQLKLLKLYDIYKLYISSFIFECQNKTSPIYFSDFFTSVFSIHSYNTRSASQGNLFLIRKSTLQYGLRSISYIGIRIWNTISSDIRNSSLVKSFRKIIQRISLIILWNLAHPMELSILTCNQKFPQLES